MRRNRPTSIEIFSAPDWAPAHAKSRRCIVVAGQEPTARPAGTLGNLRLARRQFSFEQMNAAIQFRTDAPLNVAEMHMVEGRSSITGVK
jgi:hypothetical protein